MWSKYSKAMQDKRNYRTINGQNVLLISLYPYYSTPTLVRLRYHRRGII